METKTLAIMFADLAGYTARTSQSSRTNFIQLLDTYEQIVLPVFAEFNGKIVKKLGDGFLVSFESPTNAVLCGIKIQNELFIHNQNARKDEGLAVRIAVSMGEVHLRDDDVYGEAVNIASRLEKIAKPNDVYFTQAVYIAMNKAEIPSVLVGARTFKGVPLKVRVFKVFGEYSKILIRRRKRRQVMAGTARVIIFIVLAIAAIIGLIAYLYFFY